MHQVTTGDSGIYYCTASGPDGVSKTASVQIQVVTRGWIQWRMNARTSFLVFGGDWTSNRKCDENLGSGRWSWSLLWSYRWCSPPRSFQWSAIGWRPVKAGRLRSVDAGHRGFMSLKVSKKFSKKVLKRKNALKKFWLVKAGRLRSVDVGHKYETSKLWQHNYRIINFICILTLYVWWISTQVSCLVRGQPRPKLIWYRWENSNISSKTDK